MSDPHCKEKEDRISLLENQLNAKFEARERDYQDYKCECDGTCGTGQRGRGSECARKEAKYLQANHEYLDVKTASETEIAQLRTEITSLAQQATLAGEEVDANFATGLLARLSASKELPQGPGIALALLLILIEVSPILAKLLAPPAAPTMSY